MHGQSKSETYARPIKLGEIRRQRGAGQDSENMRKGAGLFFETAAAVTRAVKQAKIANAMGAFVIKKTARALNFASVIMVINRALKAALP